VKCQGLKLYNGFYGVGIVDALITCAEQCGAQEVRRQGASHGLTSLPSLLESSYTRPPW
jgi:hypothetical protein